MKFSAAAISIFAATAAMAVPLGHEHNIHKRDVVTEVVHQTLVYYQKQVVYVDQNGSPYSTGVQVVSTAVSEAQPEPTSEAAAVSTSVDVAQDVVTSETYVAPSRTSVPESSAPTSTQQPEPTTSSSEAAPTTSSEAAPTTSSETPSTTLAVETSSSASPIEDTIAAVTSSEAASSTSAAPSASSSSASSSGGSGSGSNSGDGTYYDTGLGACGITSTDSDFIVAISHERFDAVNTGNPNNNPLCGKKITAYRGDKSVEVTVVDRCPGCDKNSLDFSPAAYDVLGTEAEGRIPITWDFQ